MTTILEVGSLAQAHRDRYVSHLVDLIDEGRWALADPDAVSRSAAEGVFGSIYGLLARELVLSRTMFPYFRRAICAFG